MADGTRGIMGSENILSGENVTAKNGTTADVALEEQRPTEKAFHADSGYQQKMKTVMRLFLSSHSESVDVSDF